MEIHFVPRALRSHAGRRLPAGHRDRPIVWAERHRESLRWADIAYCMHWDTHLCVDSQTIDAGIRMPFGHLSPGSFPYQLGTYCSPLSTQSFRRDEATPLGGWTLAAPHDAGRVGERKSQMQREALETNRLFGA